MFATRGVSMSNPSTVVDAYLSAYNEPDRDRRAELIEEAGPATAG